MVSCSLRLKISILRASQIGLKPLSATVCFFLIKKISNTECMGVAAVVQHLDKPMNGWLRGVPKYV